MMLKKPLIVALGASFLWQITPSYAEDAAKLPIIAITQPNATTEAPKPPTITPESTETSEKATWLLNLLAKKPEIFHVDGENSESEEGYDWNLEEIPEQRISAEELLGAVNIERTVASNTP